jgi:hypothetical protein
MRRSRFTEPLSVLNFLAGCTERIRLGMRADHPLPRTGIHRQDPGDAGCAVGWQANPRCRRGMDGRGICGARPFEFRRAWRDYERGCCSRSFGQRKTPSSTESTSRSPTSGFCPSRYSGPIRRFGSAGIARLGWRSLGSSGRPAAGSVGATFQLATKFGVRPLRTRD